MDQSTQIRLTREVLAHLDNRTTDLADEVMYHDIAAYASPQRLALEKQILFRKYPLLMGMSG